MELHDTLDRFPLPELITMIHTSSVTGVLEIGAAPGAIGSFYWRNGEMYHAVCGEASGLDALRCVVEWDHAPFRFIAGASSARTTIDHDALRLVEYITLINQLLQQARPYVTDTACVPVLCISERAVQVDKQTWQVLAAIDGERSIDAISALLDADVLEVSAILGGLIERQLAMLLPSQLVKHANLASRDIFDPPTTPHNGLTKQKASSSVLTITKLLGRSSSRLTRNWWTFKLAY